MRRSFEAIPPGAATQQITILDANYPLLTSAHGEALRAAGPVVRLGLDGSASLDGSTPSYNVETVLAQVAERLTQPGHDRVLYLAISPGVALGAHSALIRRLGEQAPLRVLIRDASGGPAAPVPSAAMATRLKAMRSAPPMEKPALLAEAWRAAAGTCKPLIDGFEALTSEAPDRRQATILDTSLTGVEACGCNVVDVDGLTALVWTLLMGEGPPLRWLPMLPGPAGIKLPSDARTGDLVRLLEAGPAIALPG